jgi:serine/threonine protein kinase
LILQGLKEFINEVNTLASLQHPNLCKLLGYHARDGSDQRMLVYERLYHGSLDRLLYGRSDGPPIDWNTRMKIALCAAQGLTFLHEEGPFQVKCYFDPNKVNNETTYYIICSSQYYSRLPEERLDYHFFPFCTNF